MKTVKLLDQGNFKSKDVLRQVLGLAPQGVNIEQMRQRVKILNALDDADGSLALEDTPFGVLKGILDNFQFGVSSPDLLAVLDSLTTPVEGNG